MKRHLRLPRLPAMAGVLKVGLTGGIASGQSTVARMLAAKGAHVVEADVLARQLVEPGKPGLRAVVRAFGRKFLLPGGSLNRAALGALVFRDAVKRRRLNAILHPLILREEARLLRSWHREGKRGLFVVNAALMFEAGSAAFYDVRVCVWAPQSLRLARIRRRDGLTRAGALRRIRAQMCLRRKCALCEHTVRNDSSLDALRRQVLELHRRLTAQLKFREKNP